MHHGFNIALSIVYQCVFFAAPTAVISTDVMEDSWQTFPNDFLIGTGSSSYQIEGGANDGGRGESEIDYFIKLTQSYPSDSKKVRYESGEVSSDAYHHLEEDVKLLKQLGVDFYRFSISWARILPTGDIGNINQEGIDYYNRLIDGLLEANIKPFVTMFHWEYPQPLQDLGGWTNPVMINYFVEFAHLLLRTYGDRVKLWLTHNEPRLFSVGAYANAGGAYPTLAPGISVPGVAEYLSVHHLLLSHAKVYHMYDKEFRPHQKGKIGICLDTFFYKPERKEDEAALTRKLQFHIGWVANPIFGSGDYPAIVKETVDKNSAKEGRMKSRLPKFTEQEIKDLKGSSDFFGVNHYTTYVVRNEPDDSFPIPSFEHDVAVKQDFDPNSTVVGPFWLYFEPEGFRGLLNWLKDEYNNPPMFITESGCSHVAETLVEQLNDDTRVNYFKAYLQQMLKAVNIDKANVIGYSAWSFMDSFEWDSGFNERFGFYHVDFTDPKRPRRPKKSAAYFSQILSTRKVDEPRVNNITI